MPVPFGAASAVSDHMREKAVLQQVRGLTYGTRGLAHTGLVVTHGSLGDLGGKSNNLLKDGQPPLPLPPP